MPSASLRRVIVCENRHKSAVNFPVFFAFACLLAANCMLLADFAFRSALCRFLTAYCSLPAVRCQLRFALRAFLSEEKDNLGIIALKTLWLPTFQTKEY